MQTYSTEFSSGLVEFDSNWQLIFVTALTFRLDQAITMNLIISEEISFEIIDIRSDDGRMERRIDDRCLPIL